MGVIIPVFDIFGIDTVPYGLTFEQWSIKWWSWLLKIPKNKNPANDSTGNNANVNQDSENVFFLCQTLEAQEPIPSRRISLQKGKSLFFPVINWISTIPEDGKTEEDLAMKAQSKMQSVKNLTMVVDGNEVRSGLDQFRVKSRSFYVDLPQDNILNLGSGIKRVVSDGFWILTKPIMHSVRLSTFGSCTSGMTRIGVNYEINVQEYLL